MHKIFYQKSSLYYNDLEITRNNIFHDFFPSTCSHPFLASPGVSLGIITQEHTKVSFKKHVLKVIYYLYQEQRQCPTAMYDRAVPVILLVSNFKRQNMTKFTFLDVFSILNKRLNVACVT